MKPNTVLKEELELMKERFYTSGGTLYARKDYGVGGRFKAGSVVGYKNLHGRLQVWAGKKRYYVHRVVYYLHFGVWPSGFVDHIDGNKLNNTPSNLREVSNKENCQSFKRVSEKSSSKYRGVSLYKPNGTWRSEITCNGESYFMGTFTCEKEAALAYNYKAQELGFNKEAFNSVF